MWWARALIACQALSGDFAKASFGQSLLVDQKAPPDPEFDRLIRLVAERHAGKIARLGDPTPMRVALLIAAKRPLLSVRYRFGWLGIARRVPDTTLRDALCTLEPRFLAPCLHSLILAAHRRKALRPERLPFGIVALDGKAVSLPSCDDGYAQRRRRGHHGRRGRLGRNHQRWQRHRYGHLDRYADAAR